MRIVKNHIFLSIALACLLSFGQAWCATYYVDPASSGGDGTTTATSGANAAFATVAAAQTAVTGDQSDSTLLLKKGSTFREAFTFGANGTAGHPFTLGAYGTGAKPILKGSDLLSSGWSNTPSELSDNFADNDITDWIVAAGTVAAGSGRVTATVATSGQDFAVKAITQRAEYWYGFKVNLNSVTWGDATYLLGNSLFHIASSQHLVGIVFFKSGADTLWGCIYNSDAGLQATPIATTVTANTEYNVLLYAKKSTAAGANNGIIKMWVNNTLLYSATDVDSDGVNQPDFCSVGNYFTDGSTGAATIYVDDVKVSQFAVRDNLWSKSLATQPYSVFLDTAFGSPVASVGAIASANQWAWQNAYVYLYSTSDPATAYTSPGVEASQRDACIDTNSKAYIVIDGIETVHANSFWCGALWIRGAGNVTVQNIQSRYNSAAGVLIYDTTAGPSVIIQDSEIDHNNRGIIGYHNISTAGNESYIRRCNVHNNNYYHPNSIDGDGINYSGTYAIIEDNIVANNGNLNQYSDGIHLFTEAGDPTYGNHIIVRRNIVYGQISGNTDGSGLINDNTCADNEYSYNVSYGNYGAGIAIYESSANVYNNTFYGNAVNPDFTGGGLAEISISNEPLDAAMTVNLKNNVAVATKAYSYAIYVSPNSIDQTLAITNNILYGRGQANWYIWNVTAGSNVATWNGLAAGIGTDLNADPLLTASYKLGAGSPARNAGVALWTFAAHPGDFVGNKVYGSAPDMGAYEKKQFIWDDDDMIPKKCKSTNAACYVQP